MFVGLVVKLSCVSVKPCCSNTVDVLLCSAYVTAKSPEGWLKSDFLFFFPKHKFRFLGHQISRVIN